MAENSKIEWTDHTFNPWFGCTKVSDGCKYCYAETLMDKRYGKVQWGPGNPRVRTSEANWKKPLAWNREAEKAGTRPRVFCASLADWLDPYASIKWLADLLDLIDRTPNLDWLLLTKRPEQWIRAMHQIVELPCDPDWKASRWLHGDYPANVWMGVTVENQDSADKRIPILLDIPARVRFLSCEPLLEELDIERCNWYLRSLNWVICGGESGSNRALNLDHARFLRNQCRDFNVPFFMKQIGGLRKPFPEIPDDLMIRQFPNA